MPDLRELYQEVILDHSKAPRNYRAFAEANRRADGYNPLCGDKFTVYLLVEDGIVRDIGFQGAGCAISKASASLMTEAIKGKTVAEVDAIFSRFHDMVTGGAGQIEGAGGSSEARGSSEALASASASTDGTDARNSRGETDLLGKLRVFSGVSEFPVRVKCATLAWHTLKAALEAKAEMVSTE